jgi:serine protease
MQALFPTQRPNVHPTLSSHGARSGPTAGLRTGRLTAALVGLGVLGLLAMAPAAGAERGPRNAVLAHHESGSASSLAQARVIVVYKSDRASALSTNAGEGRATPASAAAATPVRRASTLSQRHGLALSDGLTIAPRTQVLFGNGLSSQALKQRLEMDTTVEAVYIDERRRAHAAPNDPLYGDNLGTTTPIAGQWYLRAPTSTVLSSINAEAAWAVTPGSSRPGHQAAAGL